MNTSPLVSILMPVYNSYDFVRSENKNLLANALNSLLSQSYKNFELIILDNQSTDNTRDICKQYANNDARMRFIVDTQKRYPEGGIAHAATFATGKYCMIANDDDFWDPGYIETLVDHMESDVSIDLCYTNGNYIDINGKAVGKIITSEKQIYTYLSAPLSNLAHYSQNRNPIPISFGLFKREVFLDLLPYEVFDELKANVDNHFISKLLMSGGKIDFIDSTLFNYRTKERALDPAKIPGMPSFKRKDLIGFYYLRHQFLFYQKMLSTFENIYKPTQNKLDYIRSIFLNSFFKHSSGLPNWIISHHIENEPGRKSLKTLAAKYSTLFKISQKEFPSIGSFSDDEDDNIRFEPILNLNLLKNNKSYLQNMLSLLESNPDDDQIVTDLKGNIGSEIKILNKRIIDIEADLMKTPVILTDILAQRDLATGSFEKKPRVSVITASYNLAPLVEETMRSVANQSIIDFEHIVIDGGSKDGSVDILKKYPNIILISERDTGYPDAFWKGLNIARGEYILQCAISDGYATTEWLKKCIETLDANRDISLVWGFPGRLTEDSKLTAISRSQFHYNEAPRKEKMFNYWLKTAFVYPEGNLCVRKSVLMKCYPSLIDCKKNILDWLEFSYRFNALGYISDYIPVLANFGRTHGNQLGEQLGNDGSLKGKYKNYKGKIRLMRLKLLCGFMTHQFIDSNGAVLDIQFNRNAFLNEFFLHKTSRLFIVDKKFLKPSNYLKYIKRALRARNK